MEPEETRRERERDLDRLLTFVDAIVAIAITLLVLPLVELPAHVEDYGSVGRLLRDNAAELGAFLLSFVVVSRFWFVQHRAVRSMVGYDRAVAALLMLWCLSIVFLPFPTGLVAERGGSAASKALYLGTMIVSTLTIVAVQVVLRRRPDLTDAPAGDRPGDLVGDPVIGLANAASVAVALGLSLLVPVLSYYPMLLLVGVDRWVDALRGRRRRRVRKRRGA